MNTAPRVHTTQFLFKLSPRIRRLLRASAKRDRVTQGEYLRALILSDAVKRGGKSWK